MLFSSMTFLFVFMPLVMAVYFLSKKEIRNYVLLIASTMRGQFCWISIILPGRGCGLSV